MILPKIKNMLPTKKMYHPEYNDYYSVFDKNGNKICDVAAIQDVMLMCSFDNTRTYRQVKILEDCVFNVPSTRMEDKQLREQGTLPDRVAEPLVL